MHRNQSYQISNGNQLGVTGVVGILKNGEGPTVMLRADMDALPVKEATGLPYSSTKIARDEEGVEVGVSHVCGHDLHVTWLMGAARLFSAHRDEWKGTIMAAATTMRLQTIVSREIAPNEHAVLTIGALQAGTKDNIIPDDATLKLNIRTFDEGVRNRVLSAVKRICCAEFMALNAPRDPEFTTLNSYPITENDALATSKVAEAFHAQFDDKSFETQPASASEDFSVFGRNWKVPYVFWFVGGTDPEIYLEAKRKNQLNNIPSNHSPKYAPVIHPTLKTGLQAMMTAAVAWLD